MLDSTGFYGERRFGRVNWTGFWTLYEKEVRRFVKVYAQTLVAPVVTALLYLLVFTLALGGNTHSIDGMPYAAFLVPGLTMMTMSQNAFTNTSSSIVIAKLQGNIVDVLMPPLAPGEIVTAIALGGVTRGIMVGAVVIMATSIFVPTHIHDLGAVIFYGFSASLLLSTIGIIGGLWSEKFDHIAAVTNFVVIPLSFLSGTFYSIAQLSENWRRAALMDPFFYMIDGFRYGFSGHSDAPLVVGMTVLTVLNFLLLALAWRMVATGYKLKA